MKAENGRTIELSQGKTALVSARDFKRVSEHKWWAQKERRRWYVRTWIDGRHIRLHRFILNTPAGVDVDHRDSNGLDNRRPNIRNCSRRQNAWNSRKRAGCSSIYKGVNWQGQDGLWQAGIFVNGGRMFLGLYADEGKAAKAYNKAAKKHFGAFARLNVIAEN